MPLTKSLSLEKPNQAGHDGAVGQAAELPTKRAKVALLVWICCFLASFSCSLFVSLYLFPTKRAQGNCWSGFLKRKVNPTKRAQWHCWSGLASSLPPCFGESERHVNASLLSPPTKRARWHCWSGFPTKRAQEALLVGRWFSEYLNEILSKILRPLCVLAMSKPIGPKWLCWSGLGHAR